jgi:hypothetical protein
MVSIMTQVFYGLPRYLLPAETIACLMAGLAVVWIARYLAERIPQVGGRTAIALGIGAVIIALTLPWTITRGKLMVTQTQQATQSSYFQNHLFAAVDRLGGHKRLFVCKLSYVAINHTVASMMAWKLQVNLTRVHPELASQGYVFVGPHASDLGRPPPILSQGQDNIRLVLTDGPWKVYAVSRSKTTSYGQAGSLCPGYV